MKFFIDSANIDHIKEIASWGILSGVTTNPSLVSKEGKDFKQVVQEICGIVDGSISAEVISTEIDSMVQEGKEISKWHKNVTIKLPTIPNGLAVCKILSSLNIKVNMTLCFSVNQALLCASAGASYVSPFVGRLDDINQDGMALIKDIAHVFSVHKIKTEILSASIRHPAHVMDSAKAGAHIATIPYQVFKQMIQHPLTDKGLEKFLADWNDAMLKKVPDSVKV
ncbi:MAG: fructose-6-phosphate aldolase [Candidatus Melainabacteria bacterium]|nr:fructose-6-phosphate aldolase [Candidatus Melainabacteria bacterium]